MYWRCRIHRCAARYFEVLVGPGIESFCFVLFLCVPVACTVICFRTLERLPLNFSGFWRVYCLDRGRQCLRLLHGAVGWAAHRPAFGVRLWKRRRIINAASCSSRSKNFCRQQVPRELHRRRLSPRLFGCLVVYVFPGFWGAHKRDWWYPRERRQRADRLCSMSYHRARKIIRLSRGGGEGGGSFNHACGLGRGCHNHVPYRCPN